MDTTTGTGSFFAMLDEPEQRALRRIATQRTFAPNMPLIYEGDPSTHVFILLNGWGLATASAKDGGDVVLRLFGAGDLVGENSAMTGRRREATVFTLSTTQALVIAADRFNEFISRYPEACLALSHVLQQRLQEADHRSLAVATHNGAGRLAGLLLTLADRYGVRLPDGGVMIEPPLSQRLLASWADVSRETMVRALKHWRQQGLIATGRQKITIVDPAGLRQIAPEPMPEPIHFPRERHFPATGSLECAAIAVDVAGFHLYQRDDPDQAMIRRELYRILNQAFDDSGVSWQACLREDRGDGVLLVVPPDIPMTALTGPLIEQLRVKVQSHNTDLNNAPKIRLRVALHAGQVHFDAHGLAGAALVHLFRLLEAPEFKTAFADTYADLGIIVSDRLFTEVIQHGHESADPSTYLPINVAVKETRTRAWICFPEHPTGRDTSAPAHPTSATVGTTIDGESERHGLTRRELEIATLAAEGHTNQQIATKLFLSARTVESHLSRIYAKLGVTSRVGMVNALSRRTESDSSNGAHPPDPT